jgi:hypothetical protein
MLLVRSALVLLAGLVLVVSFAVLPAEDVLDAVYDESESLPYESSPVISVAEPEAAAPVRIVQPSVRTANAQRLEHRIGWTCPTCDSLIILDHTLRC